MVEEVLRLSAERGYTIFHRNGEDSNGLSDIVVVHPTWITMIRMWPYVLIMDTTYKTNNYNMPLLECVGMIPTGKNFTVATAFMCNEQATIYRWGSAINEGEPLVVLTDRESGLMPVWTSQVLHFGVETTNRAESEHSVLKLWLSTCHGDLDTAFFNIDSLIQGQITEIKYTLEISRLKEKYGAKSNPIVKNLSNKISHLGLKKIMDELKKARQMVEEPDSNCLHYLRKSHSLPCVCELVNWCQYLIPIQEEDVDILWRKLEIGSDIPKEHHRDMETEIRDLTSLLQEISTGLISNVREIRRLIKGVIHPVLPNDPCQPLSTPPPPKRPQSQRDDRRRILPKGISLTGNTSPSHIGRYESPAVQVLGLVAVQVQGLVAV
ncbi:hypothetical protein M9H77_21018 [Catharanthus roseus]|uniref:Uncharacterized protein n=1 Tax=Catharanthus roseus TaxID=4058 RepID=A0ACC0AMU8_CATRO|nr:hypothetical protein M9H77_21018 [Catharanthus roseus]